MTVKTTTTIAAIATPPGHGGVGIIRVSGPMVSTIIEKMLKKTLQPRFATHCQFISYSDAQVIDDGIAVYFPKPHSFTGEEVLELQGHGSPIAQDRCLQTLLRLGAVLARPGEFSERAFLNGKMDLVQAEAVADLIAATSEQAAQSAMRSLQGVFSARVHSIVEQVTNIRVYVEAAIDFPEEEVDFLSEGNIVQQLQVVRQDLQEILVEARQGSTLREGLQIVIAGKPNAGKSSLLNQLCGQDCAIVTDIPGTTRDILKEYIQFDGLPIHIIDTAGFRESGDQIEQEGIRRAARAMEKADRIIWMLDSQQVAVGKEEADCPADIIQRPELKKKLIFIRNKNDLSKETIPSAKPGATPVVSLSAKTGVGIGTLKQLLKQLANYHLTPEQGLFSARQRHLDALTQALQALDNGVTQLTEHHAGELLAEDLRAVQHCLGKITGVVTSDELLGKIFSEFCIGK